MKTETMKIMKAKEGDIIISSIAMIVTLISFGMLFLTLMMSFALFRFTSEVWPPAGMVRPSLMLPSLSTLIIALSSMAFWKFEKNLNDRKFLSLTLVLSLGFMVAQSLFWQQLKNQGVFVSSGIFASIIYSFTWIHAAHIVLGIGLLVWLHLLKDESKFLLRVRNVGKFWHFLGIVWLIMFVTIFVL